MKRDFNEELAALCLAHPNVIALDAMFSGFSDVDETSKIEESVEPQV